MPIDPTELARSIGALGSLDPERGLAPTLQQIADSAKQLFAADGAGLMLVDAEGQLRWASASDQTAQTLEDSQERLAQGPCAVAFSQRLPAAIRDIRIDPDWAEFTQILLGEGICAGLSVPVELDGGVIGTLDVYVGQPRDWGPSEVAALQAYAGLVGQPAVRGGDRPGQGAAGRPAAGRPGASLADRAGQGRRHGPRAARRPGRL
jgi:GAF domain-containing protein